MDKALRIWLAFFVSFLSVFFLLFFFTNSVGSSLNANLPPILGYQFIFPNPQGSAYYSALYSVPAGFVGILPILIYSKEEDDES